MNKTYKTFFILVLILMPIMTTFTLLLGLTFGNLFIGKEKIVYNSAASVHDWIERKIKISSMLDKKGSKLVFVSGSNAIYGLNAQEIENKTGIPTLNFGTHAGLTSYIFKNAKKVLKKNDIIFLPLEYEYYSDTNEINSLSSTTIEYIIGYDYDYYKNLSLYNKIQVLMYLGKLDDKKGGNEILPNHLDKRGDYIYNTGEVKSYTKTAQPYQIIINKIQNNYQSWELYKFIQWCKKNDIKVYAFSPNVYHKNSLTMEEQKSIKEMKKFYKIAGVDFIGTPEDGFFKLKYMYDTDYHLNQEGQNLRTAYFIRKIGIMKHKKLLFG